MRDAVLARVERGVVECPGERGAHAGHLGRVADPHHALDRRRDGAESPFAAGGVADRERDARLRRVGRATDEQETGARPGALNGAIGGLSIDRVPVAHHLPPVRLLDVGVAELDHAGLVLRTCLRHREPHLQRPVEHAEREAARVECELICEGGGRERGIGGEQCE